MSNNQFTGTATQPQRNRNATANCVNLIMRSTVVAITDISRNIILNQIISVDFQHKNNKKMKTSHLMQYRHQ